MLFGVVINLRQGSESKDWIPIFALSSTRRDGRQSPLPL